MKTQLYNSPYDSIFTMVSQKICQKTCQVGICALIILLSAFPNYAHSDIPTRVLVWFVFALVFVLVVQLEWRPAKKILPAVPTKILLKDVVLSNLRSTLLIASLIWATLVFIKMAPDLTTPVFRHATVLTIRSVLLPTFLFVVIAWFRPLAALALAIFGIVVAASEMLHIPWVYPTSSMSLIYLTFLILLLPFFWLSYWVNYKIMWHRIQKRIQYATLDGALDPSSGNFSDRTQE